MLRSCNVWAWYKRKNRKTEQDLKKAISSLDCVEHGWQYGVPHGKRNDWLDLVVKAVMEKNS